MDSPGVVIIGAGLCGATAAHTLRSEGFTGRVTLIGEEPRLPYLRPPLSKAFLAGTEEESALDVAPPDQYAEHRIELLLGDRAVSISPRDRRVTLASGRSVPYSDLLIATGASARTLAMPSSELAGVRSLRTLDDATALREALSGGTGAGSVRLVVVGAGWLGMEVAATARSLGAAVTVVAPDAIPLASALGPDIGRLFTRRHEQAGVEFRLGSRPVGFRGTEGRVREVVLDSGEAVPADEVVVAVGAVPNIELALSAGLFTENGILVDQFLRTSVPHVFAAGDVASPYDPLLRGHQRNEHWANAIASGEAAARSILERGNGLEAIPYFYTDQFDIGMEYSGYPSLAAGARLVFRGDPDAGEYIAFWVTEEHDDAGVVVAGMNVNVWDVQDDIRAFIASRRRVPIVELVHGSLAEAS